MPVINALRLPDFIGAGPPRTATTWLHEALSGYVGLPSGVKETDFFVWQYEKGLDWYAAHFQKCAPDRIVGEFSPNYFIWPEVRERIARDIPNCKIICTLRDPVERTYSHYRKMREGEYFSGSFEDCIQKRPRLLDWSKYASQVSAWRNAFGQKNVLVLFQDDLKIDPQMFLNQACDFIGISRIPLPGTQPRDNLVNAIPRSPRNSHLARAARVVRDRLQKRGNYAVVNWLKKTGVRDYLFSGGSSFEPLRPETDARLREIFLPETEALEKMLGRDLSAWK